MGKNNYGPRITPDRVSSGPTRFPGSMGMIFIFEFATIDTIEEKCERFEASSEIFFAIHDVIVTSLFFELPVDQSCDSHIRSALCPSCAFFSNCSRLKIFLAKLQNAPLFLLLGGL